MCTNQRRAANWEKRSLVQHFGGFPTSTTQQVSGLFCIPISHSIDDNSRSQHQHCSPADAATLSINHTHASLFFSFAPQSSTRPIHALCVHIFFNALNLACCILHPATTTQDRTTLSRYPGSQADPTDTLADLALASAAAPRGGRPSTSSHAGGTCRLKDEGSRLQVVSAGAIAGLVSRFIIAPLDVVKIRLQLQPYSLYDPFAPSSHSAPAYLGTAATVRHILKHEGLTALWKGNVPAELMYVCYAALQFSTYRTTTMLLQTALPTRLPDAAESFIAGASSGALATAITYPLDLLRTRFAAQGRTRIYSSLRGAIGDIWRDEGGRGFFRGIGPGLAQIVPYMGLFFVSYEGLRVRLAGLNMPWGSGDATAGVMASVLAKTVVFPLDLVRKRIQVQGPTRGRYVYGDIPEYSSTLRALASIVRGEGFRGLYKGLPISLVKSAPAGAVTVWTYEQSLKVMMGLEARAGEVNV